MERRRLEELLNRFSGLRIAVVGDFFLDKWLEIDRTLDEPSVETGLTAYQVVEKRCYAGAAGTVLSNLAALEAGTLYALGFLGDDGEGFEMLRILKALGVDTGFLAVSGKVMTPTYTKPVFRRKNGLEETHRLDHKNTNPTPRDLEDTIINSIWTAVPKVDALIALDQLSCEGCGVLSPRIREELAKVGERYPDLVLYADSRSFIGHFRSMIVKCNNIEALKLFYPGAAPETAANLELIEKCLMDLAGRTGRPAFISCGSRGVMTLERGKPVLVPAIPLDPDIPIDIVGAGDACSSGIVSALCCGASPKEAAFVGNMAASVTIQVIGTTGTAARSQILALYDEYCGAHRWMAE
ncbi:MAG: PfkB family carbohydrate kinase [Spirochaetaceae bacterium]|jgi:bifunctional ADP-heptose synthase (sugar kinase/adenylyltransferase)|nr:PfkB family carbohydrate kinase [Spirochaetaceae bacterium]